MKAVQVVWRFYRVGIYPFLYFLAGGGTQAGCRHEPSCSVYAVKIIERDGWIKGFALALYRVIRCHPFSKEF